MEIELKGKKMLLLPEKAIYHVEEKLLIIADVHLGKARHFLKAGVGIPTSAQQKDYNTLAQLFLQLQPEKVYFLGDLFHSDINTDWMRFETLINAFNTIEFTLIKGNHDLINNSLFSRLDIKVVEDLIEDDCFIYSHKPLDIISDKVVFAGHIHPAVKLHGKARQSVLLPCYYLSGKNFLLPSFGNLTGSYVIRYKDDDMVFVVVKEKVLQLN